MEASLDLQYQWGVNDNAEQYYINIPEWMYDFGFLVNQMKTPPDVISQIGLAIPMMLLYEVSIFACRIVERKREEAWAADEEEYTFEDILRQ